MPTPAPRHLELSRREFCRLTAAGAALLAGGGRRLLAGRPPRVVEALRRRDFPGQVDPLDHDNIRRPGNWAG